MKGVKRMGVLAGCNYACNPLLELSGCINDVVSMKKVLISRFGFKEDDIELLTDEETSSYKPTGANIKKALHRMVEYAQEGDILFFHYSGHGTLVPSRDPLDPKKMHEAIVSCDINLITDLDFRHLVNRIHHNATFTMLSDSCFSGGLIGEEKEQIGPSTTPPKYKTKSFRRKKYVPFETILGLLQQQQQQQHCSSLGMYQQWPGLDGLDHRLNIGDYMIQNFKDEASLSFRLPFPLPFPFPFPHSRRYDNGILLSGCQGDETSQDDPNTNPPHGVFSYAVMTVLDKSGRVSNKQLVLLIRKLLVEQGIDDQHPCLYSSDWHAYTPFLMEPIKN